MENTNERKGLKSLNKTQQMIFAAGAVMMVLGVGGVVLGAPLGLTFIRVATVVFAIGAVAFAAMQMMQTYDGKDIVIRRLRRIMVIGDACFILAALLMLESNLQILFPLVATTVDGYNAWVHYVYNNWVVALLVAAILEMYTTHRISSELKK